MPNGRGISIEAMGGLEAYLNDTARDHNGLTYADFVQYADQDIRPTNTKIAERFNVSSMTIGNWLKVYDKSKERQCEPPNKPKRTNSGNT